MRYSELLINGKSVRNQKEIDGILQSNKFYWLIDSEIEDAKIEIKKNTIIWHSGNFFSGKWKYGIFKEGSFYGTWENGIFENGNFKGKWNSGIKSEMI
jgi:superfamily I DNA and/or RNA helicase